MDQPHAQSEVIPPTLVSAVSAANKCDEVAASTSAVSGATNPPQLPKDTRVKIQPAKLVTATSTMYMLQVRASDTGVFTC